MKIDLTAFVILCEQQADTIDSLVLHRGVKRARREVAGYHIGNTEFTGWLNDHLKKVSDRAAFGHGKGDMPWWKFDSYRAFTHHMAERIRYNERLRQRKRRQAANGQDAVGEGGGRPE